MLPDTKVIPPVPQECPLVEWLVIALADLVWHKWPFGAENATVKL
jgi:hypothetical protein